MKKMFLILLFSLLNISSFGQKIRFSDNSNIWNYSYFSSGILPPFFWMYSDYYVNDTVIRGTTYKQLWHNSRYEIVFIREDTVLKKVFAIEPFYFTDTTEKLLYDYTLNVGDTFKTDHDAYYVNNIDSVMVNTVWHKEWHLLHDSFAYYAYSQTIVEGIGSIFDPCSPITPLPGIAEGGNVLTCFHNQGSNPPISPPFGPYYLDISPHPYYFDNSTSCTGDFLGVKMLPKGSHDATPYPNPATTYITVSFTDAITTIAISDLIGQTLYAQRCNSPAVQVDVSNLPAGTYLLRINGTEVRKFVKQ